jgi:hypothetical protein
LKRLLKKLNNFKYVSIDEGPFAIPLAKGLFFWPDLTRSRNAPLAGYCRMAPLGLEPDPDICNID